MVVPALGNEVNKRSWVYVLPPWAYEITCTKCGGHRLEWSEFESHVWCYDCEIDFYPGDSVNAGIFSGPVPIRTAGSLGCVFDRRNLVTGKIEMFNLETLEYDEFSKEINVLMKDPPRGDPYGFHDLAEMRKSVQSGLYSIVDQARSAYGRINGLR